MQEADHGRISGVFRRASGPAGCQRPAPVGRDPAGGADRTLCGAQTCVDIATFARAKLPLLRRFLRPAHGAPRHDTFSRGFRALDPDAFEDAFHRFMAAFAHDGRAHRRAEQPRIIALDGKSVRRAVEAADPTTPLHRVTA